MADFVKIGNITFNVDFITRVHWLTTGSVDIHFAGQGREVVTLRGRDAQTFKEFMRRQTRDLADMQKIADRQAAHAIEKSEDMRRMADAAQRKAKHGEAPF